MELRSWRVERGLTLEAAARELGISGANPARTFQRIEVGAVPADADLMDAIKRLTEGAVTAGDMQATRLAWLRANGRARSFISGAVA